MAASNVVIVMLLNRVLPHRCHGVPPHRCHRVPSHSTPATMNALMVVGTSAHDVARSALKVGAIPRGAGTT